MSAPDHAGSGPLARIDGRAHRMVLVRHGHVEGDYAERFLGRADPGLSDAGRLQAERLSHLGSVADLSVWSSPSRRAMETARLAFPGVTVTPQPLAMELAFGALDGLHPREAARLFPEALAHLGSHPLDARPFGGEDWTALRARAASLRTLVEDTGVTDQPTADGRPPTLVLVGHLYSLSALVAELTGVSRSAAPLVLRLDCGEALALVRHGVEGEWTVDRTPTAACAPATD